MSKSRKKRKRYRARERSALEATASNRPIEAPTLSQPWGLLGESAELTRGDLALIRQAIAQRWPVRRCVRRQIVKALIRRFDDLGEPTSYGQSEARWQIAAVRAVIAMGAADLESRRQALRDMAGRRPERL